MKSFYKYNSVMGDIYIGEEKGKITFVSFDNEDYFNSYHYQETVTIENTYLQLDEYFNHKRTIFEIDLALQGSEFAQKVYQALLNIPYGETRSYQDIAKEIGNEKASRAVGRANHNNQIAIIVPCHRVIGKNKQLVGYAGGIDKKQFLLELESKV